MKSQIMKNGGNSKSACESFQQQLLQLLQHKRLNFLTKKCFTVTICITASCLLFFITLATPRETSTYYSTLVHNRPTAAYWLHSYLFNRTANQQTADDADSQSASSQPTFEPMNFQPFHYWLEPQVCNRSIPMEQWPNAVIFIKSGNNARSIEFRQRIRETWATEAPLFNMSYLFIVGLPYPLVYLDLDETKAEATQAYLQLKMEHAEHDDILLANYLDERNHLAHKYWAQLAYMASRCQHVPYMIMTDDDMVFMPGRVHRYMQQHPKQFQGLKQSCSAIFREGEALRKPIHGKYYISKKQWPPSILPLYCTGTTQITTIQGVMAMAKAVSRLGIDYVMGFAQLDDVASGVIAKSAGVKLMQIKGVGIAAYPPIKDICDLGVLGVHGLRPVKYFDQFWSMRKRCCSDGDRNSTKLCVNRIKFKYDIDKKNKPIGGDKLNTMFTKV